MEKQGGLIKRLQGHQSHYTEKPAESSGRALPPPRKQPLREVLWFIHIPVLTAEIGTVLSGSHIENKNKISKGGKGTQGYRERGLSMGPIRPNSVYEDWGVRKLFGYMWNKTSFNSSLIEAS